MEFSFASCAKSAPAFAFAGELLGLLLRGRVVHAVADRDQDVPAVTLLLRREAILDLLVVFLERLLGDFDAALGLLARELDVLQVDGLRQQVLLAGSRRTTSAPARR